MPKKRNPNNTVVTGSGDVFADLGFSDAPELLRKAELALDINSRIRERGLTQSKAAEILGIDQPKVSALSTGRLAMFSMETLISYIVLLGGEVDVVVRKKPTDEPRIKIIRLEDVSACQPGDDPDSMETHAALGTALDNYQKRFGPLPWSASPVELKLNKL